MSEFELGSRSDLEALRRSGRGKLVMLALLLVAALGAAGFFVLRPSGIGNVEDPGKVLVIATGRTRGYSMVLGDAGFEAIEGSMAQWEEKAEEELEDLDLTGLAAVMKLADRFGYGYVVIEDPAGVDFGELEIEGGVPAFEDHVRFAVLSVGDFAFPHVMTVNPQPSEVIRDPSVSLLQALFEQPQLAELLPTNENPTVEVIQLRDRLQQALHELEQVPAAEKMAQKVVADIERMLVDEERAEPRPRLVGVPLETGTPVPLASGSILSIVSGFQVVSRDAVRADLDLAKEESLLVGPVDAEPDARRSCDAILGGAISVHDAPKYEVSPSGDALLVKTLSQGWVLWTLPADAEGCGFVSAGSVPGPGPGMDAVGVPHRSGKVARRGKLGEAAVLTVSTAGTSEQVTLGRVPGVTLSDPVWLDATHLVAIGHGDEEDSDGLFVFSTEAPDRVLRLDATAFGGASELYEVAVASAQPRRWAVSVGSYPRKLFRVELPSEPRVLFEAPPTIEAPVEEEASVVPEAAVAGPDDADAEATEAFAQVAWLDPEAITLEGLTHEGQVHEPAMSADGRFIAVAVADESLDRPDANADHEIALVSVEDGSMRLLTRNALRDESPSFTPDGRHVVFRTRLEIPRTRWVIRAPRIVELEPSPSSD